MKTLLIGLLIGCGSPAAEELPGLIYFANRVRGQVDAPVYRPDGTGAGEGFTAELFLVETDGSLSPLFSRTTFHTTPAEGTPYLLGVPVSVPGGFLRPATVRMRVWETSAGSYESSTIRGESNDVTFAYLHDMNFQNLAGLEGFTMQVVPEPSPLALGLVGLAMLWLGGRRQTPHEHGFEFDASRSQGAPDCRLRNPFDRLQPARSP